VIETSRSRAPTSVMRVAVGAILLLGAGCTGHTSAAGAGDEPRTTTMPTTPVSNPQCPTTFLHPNRSGFPEFKGGSTSVTLYGLLFTRYPIPARHDAKIVWRLTGSGNIRFQGLGPEGQHIVPEWGPEPHGSSSWHRPGDEWGTGFRFPVGGCWTIRVSRGGSEATARLLVAGS
jgi:hypothetical protein